MCEQSRSVLIFLPVFQATDLDEIEYTATTSYGFM